MIKAPPIPTIVATRKVATCPNCISAETGTNAVLNDRDQDGNYQCPRCTVNWWPRNVKWAIEIVEPIDEKIKRTWEMLYLFFGP